MHRGVLAGVPLEPARRGHRCVDALELGERPIRRAVVDVEDLVGAAERREGLGEPLLELVERRDLVEERHDHRELWSRVALDALRARSGSRPRHASERILASVLACSPATDEVIVHREIFRGVPWCVMPVVVVEDTPERLVTYLPSRHRSRSRRAPTGGRTDGKGRWRGNGVLMLRRPRMRVSIWHFWDGRPALQRLVPQLEEPFRRRRRLRQRRPRARHLDPRRADVAVQGRGAPRRARPGRLHRRAARRDPYAGETTSARSSTAASGGGTTGGPASSPTRRGVRPPCSG